MFGKVSVLVPTRKRVSLLQTMLASYRDTTVGAELASELVFRVDDDDHETQDFLALVGHRFIAGPRHKGYDSMSLFFNELAAAAAGDVLLCGNDDMVFVTKGWAPLILEAANQFPDGLFDFGFSTHNQDHYPFSCVSKKAVDAMGFLWDPTIFWGDIFLRDAMAHFGRTRMLDHVEIAHEWAGFKPDQTFNEADKNIVQRDPTYWIVTHRRAVEQAVESLKKLRAAA